MSHEEDFIEDQPAVTKTGKVQYITNKELLAEIHKSKSSFCVFTKPEYSNYDAIVNKLSDITSELIEEARVKKAHNMTQTAKAELKAQGAKAPAIKEVFVDPSTIPTDTIVFRVMTSEHIPLDPDRKRKGKGENGNHTKTSFLPFKHYVLRDNGSFEEVGRSHWKGDFETGSFQLNGGRMTNRLASLLMLLVDRYSRRSNWRSYTYLDEMKGFALLQLSQIGLQFDEAKSDNPFSFYTTTIKNCLGGETEILTREYGAIAIEKVADQDVTLLDGNGDWVKCHIYDYGYRETQLNRFQGCNQTVDIWSTPNHGWISEGQKITTMDFSKKGTTIIDGLRPSKEINDQENYKRGVIHGLIYGDGSKVNTSNNNAHSIRLCGEKNELGVWFEDYKKSTPPSQNGDSNYWVPRAWANLKELPATPGSDLDYLLGFVRGWFATDGCVGVSNSTPSLCAGSEEYEWLKQWGPLVGFYPTTYLPMGTETNFGKRNKLLGQFSFSRAFLCDGDFLRGLHRSRWENKKSKAPGKSKGKKYDWGQIEEWLESGMTLNQIEDKLGLTRAKLRSPYCAYKNAKANADISKTQWKVIRNKQPQVETRVEKVYCPMVETTGSFALARGIMTANCHTRVLNLEKKNQNIRDDLLIMHGANPSYTRQNEEEHNRALARNGIVVPKPTEDVADVE